MLEKTTILTIDDMSGMGYRPVYHTSDDTGMHCSGGIEYRELK
jgi:hypothetical protein